MDPRQVFHVARHLATGGKPVVAGYGYDSAKNFPSSEAFVARLNVNGAGVDSGFAAGVLE